MKNSKFKHIKNQLQRIDIGYTSDAIEDLRQAFYQLLEILDAELSEENEK